MANITPQTISASGIATTFVAAAAGGDTIVNARGATFLVKNGAASSITVTFTGVVPCSQGSTHNVPVTVAAGAEEQIPVPSQAVDPSTGNAAVTYSSATSVTVGAEY